MFHAPGEQVVALRVRLEHPGLGTVVRSLEGRCRIVISAQVEDIGFAPHEAAQGTQLGDLRAQDRGHGRRRRLAFGLPKAALGHPLGELVLVERLTGRLEDFVGCVAGLHRDVSLPSARSRCTKRR